MYDLIIIGGGPAGLTAAVYAARAAKSVLVLEKETAGGQITLSPQVENIPGFTSVSGAEFADKMVDQALTQGAEIEFGEVISLEDHGDYKVAVTDTDDRYEARADSGNGRGPPAPWSSGRGKVYRQRGVVLRGL